MTPRNQTIAAVLAALVIGFAIARVWPARYAFVSAGNTIYRCDTLTGRVDGATYGQHFERVKEP